MVLDPMTGQEQEPQDLRIVIAHKRFLYTLQSSSDKEKGKLQKEILDTVFAEDLAPLYEFLCQEVGWNPDASQLKRMQSANQTKLQELEAKIKDAEENLGDTEVKEALTAKADYLCRIGDRESARVAYKKAEEKTAGSGPKMDLVFSVLKSDIAFGDWHSVKQQIDKAKKLCDEGGDWERKNRLKVYEALFLMVTRDFKKAGELFLDSTATFGATELMSYETLIFYSVVTSVITLDRVDLKNKVVDAPEILTVIDSIPNLTSFLNSLYMCQYGAFFKAFSQIIDQVDADPYLHTHLRYYVREVRVVAYSQFLDSYKSVTLESMAQSFGVSVDFIDQELADFIVSNRLTAKIDKVAGVVETNRPDAKNAQYQQTIRHGDLLLNRLQRLAKVVDLE
ncbi:hypothetical protein WJX79_005321 [Trebouxia sp. C0005]|nr:MAG: proteasome regulatory subunit [Trebouxia sp. A1-2]